MSNLDLPAPDPGAAAEPRPAGARTWSLGRVIAALRLPALIALIASATTVLYDYFPDLRPDPQVQLSAELRSVAFEPRVTFGAYLRRVGESTEGYDPTNLRVEGHLFYVEARTAGLKSERSTLTWSFYDARRHKRLPQQPTGERRWYTRSGTPSDRLVYPVWASIPTDPGRYRLRFELRAKGVLLALLDSPSFGYCRDSRCGAS